MLWQDKELRHLFRVVGPHKAGSETLLNRTKQNQERGKSGIDQTVERTPGTIFTASSLNVGTGGDDYWCAGDRRLIKRRFRQFGASLRVFHHNEFPRLEITRARRAHGIR